MAAADMEGAGAGADQEDLPAVEVRLGQGLQPPHESVPLRPSRSQEFK